MSYTTLTYSHCRPILFVQTKYANNQYEVPTLLTIAYENGNSGNFDFYHIIHGVESVNGPTDPFKYFALIGFDYSDGTFGVLSCTICFNRHDSNFFIEVSFENDNLRVFPSKKIAADYCQKVYNLHNELTDH